MYHISDKIVHPMHGAGVIEDIITKNISGQLLDYYVLRLPIGSVTVMIPVNTCDSIGIRPIISCEEALHLLHDFPFLTVNCDENWNRRYRTNVEHIKSGNLLEVCCVVKSLILRQTQKPLSTGERKLLATAKQILVSELSLATDKPVSEIEQILLSAVEQHS